MPKKEYCLQLKAIETHPYEKKKKKFLEERQAPFSSNIKMCFCFSIVQSIFFQITAMKICCFSLSRHLYIPWCAQQIVLLRREDEAIYQHINRFYNSSAQKNKIISNHLVVIYSLWAPGIIGHETTTSFQREILRNSHQLVTTRFWKRTINLSGYTP